MHALKNGMFFLNDLTSPETKINRQSLENEYGDLSFFFSVVLNGVIIFFLQDKYGPILRVES